MVDNTAARHHVGHQQLAVGGGGGEGGVAQPLHYTGRGEAGLGVLVPALPDGHRQDLQPWGRRGGTCVKSIQFFKIKFLLVN